jgi:hypothetical protein
VRALRELRRDGRKRQARLDHDSGEIEGLQLWRGLPPVLTLNAHGGREGQRLCFFWLSGGARGDPKVSSKNYRDAAIGPGWARRWRGFVERANATMEVVL